MRIFRLFLTVLTMMLFILATGAFADDTLFETQLPDTETLTSASADVNGDGVNDAVYLSIPKPSEASAMTTVDHFYVSAIDGKNGAWLGSLKIDSGDMTMVATLRLAVPLSQETYILATGEAGNAVTRAICAVLVMRDGEWINLFDELSGIGMDYTLEFADGPKVGLSLANGTRYTMVPDREAYVENGWIDADGKCLPALVDGAVEKTGFASLEPLGRDGQLVLLGSQTLCGAHKMDVLGTLKTAWRHDGQAWSVDTVFIPQAGVAVTPQFLTPFYYNPNGGSYFHIDFACSSANLKYQPMQKLPEDLLDQAPYNKLRACKQCAYIYVDE